MLTIYKSEGKEIFSLTNIEKESWINLVNPSKEEIILLSESLKIPLEYLYAALDEEERSRVEVDETCTIVLVDVPVASKDTNERGIYYTVPLSIIITSENIITVSLRETDVIKAFIDNKVKSFTTAKKTRFLLQILYRNSKFYLQYLKNIDKTSDFIENRLHKSLKNEELIQLLELEKSLVYFSTSLKSNELVLEKIQKAPLIVMYPDDMELLEDVIIENKQAIEMANIYSNILSGTMDAYASVISNNLNMVMKFLTSVTIIISIPTMIASFFGMNVYIPSESSPYAFAIIFSISVFFSVLLSVFMVRKELF
jgi:magnesium transporter